MVYSHSHTSSYLPEDNNAYRSLYIFDVAAGFMLVEAAGGLLSGSLVLLTDAGHMLTGTTAPLFALLAVQFSRRPPTIRHTFNWLRLTMFTASVNAIALVIIVVLIVWEAVRRLRISRPVKDGMMMAIAVAGLSANILSFWLLHHGSEEKDLNIQAATLHVFGDLLGSVGAITIVLIVIWTGWTPADLILSILVSLLILRSAWRLLKDSVNELLGGAPVSLDIAELKRRMCREIPEIRDVHYVYVQMVGKKPVMTSHMQAIPPHDRDALSDQTQHYLIDHYQIEYAIIQMGYRPCHEPDCHLNEGMFGHSHHHH